MGRVPILGVGLLSSRKQNNKSNITPHTLREKPTTTRRLVKKNPQSHGGSDSHFCRDFCEESMASTSQLFFFLVHMDSTNGLGWWFGARWVWIPIGSPKMNPGLLLRGLPNRIPNHRAPNHQLAEWNEGPEEYMEIQPTH